MSTVGYLFILISLVIIRQVTKGRVMNLGEDISDVFLSLVSGDTDALGEVLTRTGDSAEASQAYFAAGQGVAGALNSAGEAVGGLVSAAVKRGKAAKGYRWTATGPDYYDCSGLMWRACQDLGYKGSRFTTSSVASRPGFTRVAGPNVEGPGLKQARIGDIVLWPGHHMGVMTDSNQFYSARSAKSGIGYAAIKGFRKEAPVYLRFTPPSSKG